MLYGGELVPWYVRSEDNLREFLFITWVLPTELISTRCPVPGQSLRTNFLLQSRVLGHSHTSKSPPQKPQRQNSKGSSFLFSCHTEVLVREKALNWEGRLIQANHILSLHQLPWHLWVPLTLTFWGTQELELQTQQVWGGASET